MFAQPCSWRRRLFSPFRRRADQFCRSAPLGGASLRLFHGVGVVREVDAEHGRLVVSHEDIPGLMPAMVMAFAVDPPSLARGLKPGDKIEFDVTAKTYIIKNLKPTGGGKK